MQAAPETEGPEPANSAVGRRQRYWVHILLFVLTFASAVVANVLLSTDGTPAWLTAQLVLHEPSRILRGVPFAAVLMSILLAHEMGHYVMARRYGVDQSLPYFIPAPNIFGSLGAVILMRAEAPDRSVLLKVAVSGPIAGLLIALPAAAWGLAHSEPRGENALIFGSSLLFEWVNASFGPGLPVTELQLHPVALAGWVGLFVTSLNLIPAAQLDGGHVAYALFGERQESLSFMLVGALLTLGVMLGLERGLVWVVWALLLFVIGIRHPPVHDEARMLSRRQRALGLAALALFVLTFVPSPIRKPEPSEQRAPAIEAPFKSPKKLERRRLPREPEEFRL